MRIIAGQWRGRRLASVGKGDAGAHLRPTPDRVRESLFSYLAARDVLEGAHVLDLFAGTGALGFEALSRGAAHATFVENGRVGQKLIAANIGLLGAADQCRLVRKDARRLGMPPDTPCDLVFLDPPYGKDLGAATLIAACSGGWLAAHATVLWEESAPMAPPDGFEQTGQRRFGDTYLTMLECKGVAGQ